MRSSSSTRLISPSGSVDDGGAVGAHGGDERRRVRLLERRLQRAQALAELGPEHLEVGLDDVGDELVLAADEAQVLDVELVEHDVAEALDGARLGLGQRHDDLGQRLARLDRRGVARGAAHLDHAPRRRHVERHAGVDGLLVGDRPGAQVHALAAPSASDRAHQVLVQLLGDERRERREQLGHRDERLVQRVVGGQLVGVALALPEATPAAAHVPVAEVVDELLDRAGGAGGVVGLEAGGDVLDERVELADEPAVEQRPLLDAATPAPPGRTGRCWRRA